jgi:hypothetical protein
MSWDYRGRHLDLFSAIDAAVLFLAAGIVRLMR